MSRNTISDFPSNSPLFTWAQALSWPPSVVFERFALLGILEQCPVCGGYGATAPGACGSCCSRGYVVPRFSPVVLDAIQHQIAKGTLDPYLRAEEREQFERAAARERFPALVSRAHEEVNRVTEALDWDASRETLEQARLDGWRIMGWAMPLEAVQFGPLLPTVLQLRRWMARGEVDPRECVRLLELQLERLQSISW